MFHSNDSNPTLTPDFKLLAGVRDLEPGLLRLLRQLNENNLRRLCANRPAEGSAETPATDLSALDGRVFRPSGAGREALANYLMLAQKLRGLNGNRRSTRILSLAQRDEGFELIDLGARFARHASQGCSVTGVRIRDVRLSSPAAGWSIPCLPVQSNFRRSNADATAQPSNLPQAAMGGVFDAPGHQIDPGSDLSLDIELHNVLGHTRPIVPVFVQLEWVVGVHAPYRFMSDDSKGAFVFATDLEPGERRQLSISTEGLLDTLPCPPGLLEAVRFVVWLPTAHDLPNPIPTAAAISEGCHLRLVG